jgi:molybdopterin converting factor small subunit
MQIQVRLFSILRDCLPAGALRNRATVDLPDGACLADLIVQLGIDKRLGYAGEQVVAEAGWQVLVNGSFEPDMRRVLQAGDQVQIFPPVAGGSEEAWMH